MEINFENIQFDNIINENFINKNISLTVARLDKIHDDVSGNKLFKLHYFIKECLQSSHKTMLTFGGAFSNHLVATAFFCKEKGIKAIGIVRGEEPKTLSHTLERCKKLGMILEYISRKEYEEICSKKDGTDGLRKRFGDFTLMPEGGYSDVGANGASIIMNTIPASQYSHICTAVGTATTLAGLLLKKEINQEIVAIPVIKNMTDLSERLKYLGVSAQYQPLVFEEYHFGGYAKKTPKLISFMNSFFIETLIPTDLVYTAKMMYAIYDKIENGYFTTGSRILCLHTGGLQGNKSLPKGTLRF